MSAGEKTNVKEIRRQKKERHKSIENANKMLIPVNKRTTLSLGIISFDPNGVFYLEENRWMKVFKMDGDISRLVNVVKKLTGRIRITLHIGANGGRETCHLSLIEIGESYEEVSSVMKKDETEIKDKVNLNALTIDEIMNQIANNFNKDISFSYASYVRGNKDWKKEIFMNLKDECNSFMTDGFLGESFNALTFPTSHTKCFIDQLEVLMCPMFITIDINSLTDDEHQDFKRAIEKRYNTRLPINTEESFINLSLSLVVICDSIDIRKILEDSILSILFRHGIMAAPSFHKQKLVAESALSMGLIDNKIMRNVSLDVLEEMLGGGLDENSKIKI